MINQYSEENSKITPLRVNTASACQILDISLSSLKNLMKMDDFPKPYKMGNAMQSPLYFDFQELKEWHERQKQGGTNA